MRVNHPLPNQVFCAPLFWDFTERGYLVFEVPCACSRVLSVYENAIRSRIRARAGEVRVRFNFKKEGDNAFSLGRGLDGLEQTLSWMEGLTL